MVFKESLAHRRYPLPDLSSMDCVYLKFKAEDRLEILLLCWVLHIWFLSEVAELVLELVMMTPILIVLGGFNICAEASSSGFFFESLSTLDLFQVVSGLTYKVGHTLDLMFATGWIQELWLSGMLSRNLWPGQTTTSYRHRPLFYIALPGWWIS